MPTALLYSGLKIIWLNWTDAWLWYNNRRCPTLHSWLTGHLKVMYPLVGRDLLLSTQWIFFGWILSKKWSDPLSKNPTTDPTKNSQSRIIQLNVEQKLVLWSSQISWILTKNSTKRVEHPTKFRKKFIIFSKIQSIIQPFFLKNFGKVWPYWLDYY
jgi:hypothetical protein